METVVNETEQKSELKRFVVDRRRWLRGEGPGVSRLLRKSDGKMCCVGFFATQVKGHSESEILEARIYSGLMPPGVVVENLSHVPVSSYAEEATIASIYSTNDNEGLNETNREESLKKLFAVLGYEIVFEN